MGTCYNCGTQLTLQEGQTRCDKCANVVYYNCWSCKQGFETTNEEGLKREECKVCGYFICPNCGNCGQNCQKNNWQDNLMKILAPEINFTNNPELKTKVPKIIKMIEEIKISIDRKECPNRVPITYAKSRIKSLLAKVEGFRTKNESDKNAFEKRIKEITDIEIGKELTVSSSREAGSYGQEYRDAFNLLVCLGKLRIIRKDINDKDGKKIGEYYSYQRIDGTPCKHLVQEDFIINECPKCKKKYPRVAKFCSECHYTRGDKKGQSYQTKERLNNIDSCQLYRGDFCGRN